MILILKMEDGTAKPIDKRMSVDDFLAELRRLNVETIVAGDMKDGQILWEKQFQACTVMPSREASK